MCLVVLFGIIPASIAVFNGLITGRGIAKVLGASGSEIAVILILHGIFELPAMMIAWRIGIRNSLIINPALKSESLIDESKQLISIFVINIITAKLKGKKTMRYSQAKQGRTFIIRLEDGDIVHKEIEKFAHEKSIKAAALIILGGADIGSKLIVGPQHGRGESIIPMEHILDNVHEIAGTGTIFPDERGKPILHMHIACGRKTSSVTGCVRKGVKTWHVMEVILFELVDTTAVRAFEPITGFELLKP
jgi:predicted DNA-binding protein with PD1-like motif